MGFLEVTLKFFEVTYDCHQYYYCPGSKYGCAPVSSDLALKTTGFVTIK